MASLLGEGGLGLLGGSCQATATAAVLADFTTNAGNIATGTDGRPCNVYEVVNRDTSNTLIVHVRATGLHETTGTAYPIYPGEAKAFQVSYQSNEVFKLIAWVSDLDNATTSSNTMVSGGVISRRR